jgi:hypothetical protein
MNSIGMTQLSIPVNNVKLVRRCGRVLFAVFLLTVAAALFPLRFQSIDWALRLAQSIVNSASLALVGVGLLRYAAFLELQASAESKSDPQTPYGTLGEQEISGSRKSRSRTKRGKTDFGIRRLALAGTIALLLLSAWQYVLFFRGLDSIASQALSVSTRADKQVKDIELVIEKAPDLSVDAEWKRVQSRLSPPSSTTASALDTAGKRKQLLAQLQNYSQQSMKALQQQSSGARWNLGLEVLRSSLLATIYAWGFYGLYKL